MLCPVNPVGIRLSDFPMLLDGFEEEFKKEAGTAFELPRLTNIWEVPC
jgi:hypothetical protein